MSNASLLKTWSLSIHLGKARRFSGAIACLMLTSFPDQNSRHVYPVSRIKIGD